MIKYIVARLGQVQLWMWLVFELCTGGYGGSCSFALHFTLWLSKLINRLNFGYCDLQLHVMESRYSSFRVYSADLRVIHARYLYMGGV